MENSVPLGVAGTGSAFILPQESQAANRLLGTIDYNTQVDALNQRNRQKAAHDLAKSYQENAFKAKNGTLFNNELLALQQKHVQQGSDYAKQGFDIYNPNPNDANQMAAHDQYMADRAKLYNMQDVRDELQKHLVEQDKKVSESPAGKFDSGSIQKFHDFYQKNTLRGIIDNGLEAPSIREAFNPENIYSKAEPVMTGINETENGFHKRTVNAFMPNPTRANGESSFLNEPGGKEWIQEQTGISADKARVLPDKLNDIHDFNDQYYRKNPQGQQELVNAGITSYSDPKYSQLLQQKSLDDYNGKRKYNQILDIYTARARAKAHGENRNVVDYTGLNYQRELNKDKQKEEPGELVFGNGESTAPVVYQNFTTDNKPVTHSGAKGKQVEGGYVQPEQGATLFSQQFPQTKVTVKPGSFNDIQNGHNVKNTKPFEATVGSVSMEPVWQGRGDNLDGAVMSKNQLMDAIKKNDFSKISFSPIAYGTRPVKDKNNQVHYQPVSFSYDALRGNGKIKTTKFEKAQQQFNELVGSPDFKNATAQERFDFLSKFYNLQ